MRKQSSWIRRFTISCTLVLCLGIPEISMADEQLAEPTFQMELIAGEDEIMVNIDGLNLVDMYAYEMDMTSDALRLKLVDASNNLDGFTVSPTTNGHRIRFAHTKMGRVNGINGNRRLGSLVFERIRGGDVTLTLDEVKLVSSDLAMVSYFPDSQISIHDDRQRSVLRDIAGHWAESAIKEAVELGFVSGYGDDTFQPNRHITRAEFVVLLTRAMQLQIADVREDLPFSDREDIPEWARQAVSTANASGWVAGYEDRSFRANARITRTELAAILVRTLGLDTSAEVRLDYADFEQIPAWGQRGVRAATDHGLLQGRGNNVFAPNERTTRAEAVMAILKALRFMNGIAINGQ